MSAFRSALLGAAALALLLTPVTSATAAGPSIGRLGVGGTGCPAGTVRAALGSDQLSLQFSRYVASAGGGRGFDRKACGISIPFRWLTAAPAA